MGTFADNIRSLIKRKDILVRLIVINVSVFLILAIVSVLVTLFKINIFQLIDYVAVSSDIGLLITRPWTIFTYMFVHKDILHILFNMLLLFSFGRIFLSYFNPKQLGSLYILGGLAGAILYILAFNTIPYYVEMNHVPMIGASASVMAVIFASAFYNPNLEVGLLLIGRIKIIYIALFIFILDFISLGDGTNPGGHVAHIGGAAIGYLFAKQYKNGKDITRWITRLMDIVANISVPKKATTPKMKVKYKNRDADYDYNQRKKNESEEIDRILDKIKASGYTSLNSEEKKQLFDASKK